MFHNGIAPALYYAVAFLAILGGGFASIRSKTSKQLISDLKDRTTLLEKNDQEKGEEIKHLQGQIDVLKTLPLKGIDKSLKLLVEYTTKHDELVTQAKTEIIRAIEKKL